MYVEKDLSKEVSFLEKVGWWSEGFAYVVRGRGACEKPILPTRGERGTLVPIGVKVAVKVCMLLSYLQ